MSRIGLRPITIPEKVKVTVDGSVVKVEGPRGKMEHTLPSVISASLDKGVLTVKNNAAGQKKSKALHGLSRSLVANMVEGVSKGFQTKLEIQGVGFKAAVQGSQLNLSLGFSHPVLYDIPADIKITVTDNVNVSVEGFDKQRVGAVAADIRRYYPPEPYKGKGVRYAGEKIIRKEGKTAQGK
ncbi:50S ribosomal protein L6 [Verrucomicrobia bacterium LW23]|nr:50S ribosomal protein L6 [Verrucomicrobia bacterium LW23]